MLVQPVYSDLLALLPNPEPFPAPARCHRSPGRRPRSGSVPPTSAVHPPPTLCAGTGAGSRSSSSGSPSLPPPHRRAKSWCPCLSEYRLSTSRPSYLLTALVAHAIPLESPSPSTACSVMPKPTTSSSTFDASARSRVRHVPCVFSLRGPATAWGVYVSGVRPGYRGPARGCTYFGKHFCSCTDIPSFTVADNLIVNISELFPNPASFADVDLKAYPSKHGAR